MTMKHLFVSLLAVAAMASCSKNDSVTAPEGPQGDAVEIKATSKALSIESKAPFEGEIGDNGSLTARILVSVTQDNYTTTYKDDNMTFTDNGITEVGFATPAYYPADGSPLYLCGLYPADQNWQNPTTTADYTFDGKTDIMAAAQVSSSKTAAQAGTYPTLAFKHLLTKLVVKAVAEDQAAIDAWGDVTAIVLTKAEGNNPYTKATVTLASGTAATGTAFATTLTAFPFYTMMGETYNDVAFTGQTCALTTTAANIAYSMVAPITATGTGDFKLKITTQKGSETALENEVTIDLKDTAGSAAFTGDTQNKSFVITLTFKATEIKAKATVGAWEEGGSAGAELQ